MRALWRKLTGLGGNAGAPERAAPAPVVTGDDGETLLINAYATRLDAPAPDFPHTARGWRDLSDPALAPHLQGFIGYVLSRGDGTMTRTRYHLMRHLQRVRQHWSLSVASADLDACADWAARANAVLFLPDGSIRDDRGRPLLDAAGQEPDPHAALPHPPQAWERKARTEALLAARGLDVPAHLPPLISEPELDSRRPEDIAGRAFALLAVAAHAESLASGEPLAPQDILARLPSAGEHLSPAEKAFLADPTPQEADGVRFGWRYECLAVMVWMLGLPQVELPFPETICDVPRLSRLLVEAGSVEGLLRAGTPRAPSDLLDALDLHYRLHWRLRESRQRGMTAPAGVDAGVVQERHHALNWLVRFEEAAWDEVDTPT